MLSSKNKRPPCPPPQETGIIKSLYKGALAPFLELASSKLPTDLSGAFMDSPLSKCIIKGFIKKSGIDMSQYPQREYRCFNDFFTREINPALRPLPRWEKALMSPCDSRLTCYNIDENLVFRIKGGSYSVESLLKNRPLAREYAGGLCLVFRLAVDDYHRYCYFDKGTKGENIRIPGRYYTVQPIALERADFFKENTREYSLMDTENFGKAVQVEIGAAFVGRIVNHHGRHSFARGEEKGMFRFGGSTIVLLLKKGVCQIDGDILENSAQGFETRVLMGETIGRSII